MIMTQETVSKDTFDRAKFIEEMRRLLYEGMKKAEQDKNWEVFNRFADTYIKMSR